MRKTNLVFALILGSATVLAGCAATPLSPELHQKAEAAKGQTFVATETVFEGEVAKCDNGTDDARACSRDLLRLAVQKQAYDKCVRYRIRHYQYWDSTFVGYVRGFHPVHFSTQATANVTCLGADD